MVTMEHPNGCIHNVRDDLVTKFQNSGWTIKAAPSEPPKPKRTPAKKKTEAKK